MPLMPNNKSSNIEMFKTINRIKSFNLSLIFGPTLKFKRKLLNIKLFKLLFAANWEHVCFYYTETYLSKVYILID